MAAQHQSKAKVVLFKTVLVLVAATFACGILELGLRIKARYDRNRGAAAWQDLQRAKPPKNDTQVHLGHIIHVSPYPDIVYQLWPNLSVTFLNSPLTTDAEGFRITPGSDARTDAYRIVGLGDSVMFGWGVADHETYLARLCARLQNENPEQAVHVLNTAVPGYNTVMELATLRERALRYAPDLVLIHYVENDLDLPKFILERDSSVRLTHSYLLAAISKCRGGAMRTAPLDSLVRTPDEVPRRYRHMVGQDACRRALRELHRLAAEHTFKIAVITNWSAPPHVRTVTDQLGIPLIELGGTIRAYREAHHITEYGGSALTISKEDPHFSALAHELVAQTIFERLTEWKLVPAREPKKPRSE